MQRKTELNQSRTASNILGDIRSDQRTAPPQTMGQTADAAAVSEKIPGCSVYYFVKPNSEIENPEKQGSACCSLQNILDEIEKILP